MNVGFDPMLSYNSDPTMMGTTGAPLVQDAVAATGGPMAQYYDSIATTGAPMADMFVAMGSTDIPHHEQGNFEMGYDMYGAPVQTYVGDNATMAMEYGDPAALMGTADQAAMDTANAEVMNMMDSEQAPDMDPQLLDGIAAQMTSGEGEFDVVAELEDDIQCEDLGKSDFGIQTAGLTGMPEPIYQIDYAAECRYKKDMQGRARKVGGIYIIWNVLRPSSWKMELSTSCTGCGPSAALVP